MNTTVPVPGSVPLLSPKESQERELRALARPTGQPPGEAESSPRKAAAALRDALWPVVAVLASWALQCPGSLAGWPGLWAP